MMIASILALCLAQEPKPLVRKPAPDVVVEVEGGSVWGAALAAAFGAVAGALLSARFASRMQRRQIRLGIYAEFMTALDEMVAEKPIRSILHQKEYAEIDPLQALRIAVSQVLLVAPPAIHEECSRLAGRARLREKIANQEIEDLRGMMRADAGI